MDIFRIISAMIKLATYLVMVKVLILQNIGYCCAAGRAAISFSVILVSSFCIGLLILNVWVNFSPSILIPSMGTMTQTFTNRAFWLRMSFYQKQ